MIDELTGLKNMTALVPQMSRMLYNLADAVPVQHVPDGQYLQVSDVAITLEKRPGGGPPNLTAQLGGQHVDECGILGDRHSFQYTIGEPAPHPDGLPKVLSEALIHFGLRHDNPDRCPFGFFFGDFHYIPAEPVRVKQNGHLIQASAVRVRDSGTARKKRRAIHINVSGPVISGPRKAKGHVGLDWFFINAQPREAGADVPELVAQIERTHRLLAGICPTKL